MIQPKKIKYSKTQRGKMARHLNSHGFKQQFPVRGDFAVVSKDSGYLLAGCLAIVKKVCGRFFVGFNLFPNKGFTRKPVGIRMGGGKGAVTFWAAPVLSGQILFELRGPYKQVFFTFNKIRKLLPLKTCLVNK